MSAEPAPTFADADQLSAYFERMAVRARVIYAHAPFLPRHAAVVALVQRLRAEGRATFVQQRSPQVPGFTHYILEKLPDPAAAAPLPGTGLARLLAVLADCAAHGLECPSNETLAELLGLSNARAARTLFDRAVAEGHLKVIEPARFGARLIELTATGSRTAAPGAKRRMGADG